MQIKNFFFYFLLLIGGTLLTQSFASTSMQEEILSTYGDTEYIHNPAKVKIFKQLYTNNKDFTSFNNEEDVIKNEGILFGVQFAGEAHPILRIQGLSDCVGVLAWWEQEGEGGVFHCSKAELDPRNNAKGFREQFLDELKKRQVDFKDVQVHVASSLWNEDIGRAITLLEESGFNIKGVSIPDIVFDRSQWPSKITYYFDKANFSTHDIEDFVSGKKRITTSMTLNTTNGKVGYLHTFVE